VPPERGSSLNATTANRDSANTETRAGAGRRLRISAVRDPSSTITRRRMIYARDFTKA
jgi:hypothetical protein